MDLFTWDFWFSPFPVRFSPFFERAFLIAFLGSLVLALVARITARRPSMTRMASRLFFEAASALSIVGLVGLVWWFASTQEVRFFGVRGWFLAIALLGILLAVRIWRKAKKMPDLQAQAEERRSYSRYFPRRSR